MAHEDLWQNEDFRKAFQRWWDADWSWEGLATKYRRAKLAHEFGQTLGSLQDIWRDEEGKLIRFAGRRWTRFHLPPFDRDGNACPAGLWTRAKGSDCTKELYRRLDASPWPDETELKEYGLFAVTEFADLQGVFFPQEFEFDRETLVAEFHSAIFIGPSTFRGQILARFGRAIFAGDVRFDGATFWGEAWFARATFSGTAEFGVATFSWDAAFFDAAFCSDVNFGRTRFLGGADFVGVTVSRRAQFDGAAFVREADFRFATFSQDAEFKGAKFSAGVWFDGATFTRNAMFDGTAFSGKAGFAGTVPFAGLAQFDYTCFGGEVDFSGREFKGATDFSSAQFSGVPKFHGAKLHPDTTFQNAYFRDGKPGRPLARPQLAWFGNWWDEDTRHEIKQQLRAYWRWRRVPFGLRHPAAKKGRRAQDAAIEEYEIAYRQLRRLCAEIGSIEYEGLFHALELRAHRARTDTNPTARLASWLYDVLSDYGRSMGRPLIALLGAWTFFSTAYLLLLTPPYSVGGPDIAAEVCQGMAWPSRTELWTASAREFLPSLFGMSSVSNRPEWLRCAEGNHQFLFFALSVSQVMTFIACVSLFLIALRRRFQLRD